MDKSKVLVILGPSDYLQEELLQEEQIQYVYAYLKAQTFGGKLFRRGCLLLGMQNYMFSHNTRGIDLSKFDLILIDEMIYPEYVIDFIRQHNSHCKIVYWLWNTVKFGGQWRGYDKWGQWYKLLNLREKYKFQITSFDKGDCNKYDLLENGQVATRFKDLGNKPKEILFDIFFCGQDKGRLSLLIQLAKYFDGVGITYKFWIVPDDHKQYSAEEKLYLLPQEIKNIPYRKVIETVQHANAILDIVQKGQNGMTWRPLESLFYKKKLITNYEKILQMDFYSDENIFLLNRRSNDDLLNFLNTPCKIIDSSIVRKYTFDGWVENLYKML